MECDHVEVAQLIRQIIFELQPTNGVSADFFF
jgi:hypothetical protein